MDQSPFSFATIPIGDNSLMRISSGSYWTVLSSAIFLTCVCTACLIFRFKDKNLQSDAAQSLIIKIGIWAFLLFVCAAVYNAHTCLHINDHTTCGYFTSYSWLVTITYGWALQQLNIFVFGI